MRGCTIRRRSVSASNQERAAVKAPHDATSSMMARIAAENSGLAAMKDHLVGPTAILFGEVDLFVIAGLQLLMLVALIFIGDMAELGGWYYGSVGLAAILMGYHQWLARDRKPTGCFEAFLHNRHIGLVVFVGILLHYVFNP